MNNLFKLNPLLQYWMRGLLCAVLVTGLAIAMRMLEWPCWQNPEYRLGNEMLLATHDAYHWVSGAVGFGRAVDHPMAVMLHYMAWICNCGPAQAAFWFPAILASMVACLIFLWGWVLGSMQTGIAAGLIACIAPGFLARTLLGFYDTDLVTLFFPLLISLMPAFWCMRHMLLPQKAFANLTAGYQIKGLARFLPFAMFWKRAKQPFPIHLPGNALDAIWIAALGLSGLLAWWTQQWHSVFPYLIRYNIFLLAIMSSILSPPGHRSKLLAGSGCYALPALIGLPGLAWCVILMAACSFAPEKNREKARFARKFPLNPWVLSLLWCLIVYFFISGGILDTLTSQINAYLKNSADTHASQGVPLTFPSVAQSIIEVQDLSFTALFSYFHPWLEAAAAGMIGFGIVIIKRPATLFLLPLAVLGLLSAKLGGRMVMFGAPVIALGLSFPIYWLISRFMKKSPSAAGWLSCILLCVIFVAPFLDMIPALSQGPIINRRHAAALVQAGRLTPPDSTLWLWWDWGYAAHYFARRSTIADGAEHGGPSLYLPAAVFASDNPRFARQIIRYTSSRQNVPGNVFAGLDALSAQKLINQLQSSEFPLVRGSGRQYLVTSFEMLRLGFWISNFGNWNFVTCQSEGGALSIVPQALEYKLSTGEVRLGESPKIILPMSITVFDETGIISRNYVQEWFNAHPKATPAQQKLLLESRRNINFLFNRVTDEKLAMDEGIFRSMMARLLVCDPHDPGITPYFKLVYDNVFARIYEVMPVVGGED